MTAARLWSIGALFALLTLPTGPAHAHEIGLSRGVYTLDRGTLSAELALSSREAALVATGGVGLSGLARVEGCQATEVQVLPDPRERDGVLIDARFTCPEAMASARVDLRLLTELTDGHRHLARAGGPDGPVQVLTADAPTLVVQAGLSGATAAATTSTDAWTTLGAMFALGVEHILIGFDHLLFLFALLLLAGRLRDVALVITAFTLSHSVTLAMAATGLWVPSGNLIEPLIALSVAWVGLENLLLPRPRGRWRLALAFGFIHGFGFAGVLGEIGLPADQVAPALLGFNLGVEAGQLLVMAAVVPLVALARRRDWYLRRAMPALSLLVAAIGLGWFVERLAG